MCTGTPRLSSLRKGISPTKTVPPAGTDADDFSERLLDDRSRRQALENRVDHDHVEFSVSVGKGVRRADCELDVRRIPEERIQSRHGIDAGIHAMTAAHATCNDAKESAIPGPDIEDPAPLLQGKLPRQVLDLSKSRLGVAIGHQRRVIEMGRPEIVSFPVVFSPAFSPDRVYLSSSST